MIANPFRNTLLFCSSVLLFVSSVEGGQKQQVTGRVIAKDAYAGLAQLSSATNVELFIVKVDTRQGARRFIKVRYEDYADQRPLPTELSEGKSRWTFSLTRNKTCDQEVSAGLFVESGNSGTPPKAGTFILVPGAGHDVPPIKAIIPCFVLRPGGVKRETGDIHDS
jgi:hypothetical protein